MTDLSPFSTMSYLQRHAQKYIKLRKPLPKEKKALMKRNILFKKRLIDCLGGFPEDKDPLNSKVADKSDIGDCIEERIYFDSEKNVVIPALLLRAKNLPRGKRPAIITIPCWGQRKEGSGFSGWRNFQIMAAKNGYITIAIENRSHGERLVGTDFEKDMNTAAGIGLLIGKSFFSMSTWDIIRTIDYLQTRSDVNPERIGITGLCWGGQQTYLAGALDKRLKVVVPICSNSTYEALVEVATYYAHTDTCPYIPNLLKYGDVQDILALIAPRPIFLMNNYSDWWFPIPGFKKLCRELCGVYKVLGHQEKFRYVLRSTDHDITPEFGKLAKDWFDKWL